MKALLQRVTSASVTVENKIVGSIDSQGLCIFLGIHMSDTIEDAQWLVKKIISLRVFADINGKMSKSIQDIQGKLLIVSQFTLCCVCTKGCRPDCTQAARPEKAEELYNIFIQKIHLHTPQIVVQTGQFAAKMQVQLSNDGPFTVIIDSKE